MIARIAAWADVIVATLLLGGGLANFLKFSALRKNLRLDLLDQRGERQLGRNRFTGPTMSGRC
jgi:hypothetical protein